MSRKKSREYAFRLVFEKFFHEPEQELEFNDEEFVLDDTDKLFVNELIGGVNSNYDSILDIIKNNVVGYEVERIYKIDLAISYQALTIEYLELLHNAGLKVNCWTVDSKLMAEHLASMGVDYITTNILE